MSRTRAVSKYRVPYLRDSRIEDEARLLLDEWQERSGAAIAPPIPIEDIIELHLGLEFSISDLEQELGHPDVLGAIWFGSKKIKVDQSLDFDQNPRVRGRYFFTLAHEVGHWRLHRQHLAEDPSVMMLFDENGEPAFVCRSTDRPPEEWQADTFASCVLMPRSLVFEAWQQWRGTDDAVRIDDLPVGDYHGDREADRNMAMENFCKPLADRFEVSAQAMRIRLQKLKLLVEEIEPKLF
ncbi:MAG: ImmA/IrrE family metallo-endopeptidase [Planctomycetota bacterium]